MKQAGPQKEWHVAIGMYSLKMHVVSRINFRAGGSFLLNSNHRTQVNDKHKSNP
jgi:hypothetical protein